MYLHESAEVILHADLLSFVLPDWSRASALSPAAEVFGGEKKVKSVGGTLQYAHKGVPPKKKLSRNTQLNPIFTIQLRVSEKPVFNVLYSNGAIIAFLRIIVNRF